MDNNLFHGQAQVSLLWTILLYFQYGDLTRNEAMNWLQNSADQPNAVYDIARDISQELLRELITDASRIGWGMVMDVILILLCTAVFKTCLVLKLLHACILENHNQNCLSDVFNNTYDRMSTVRQKVRGKKFKVREF